MEKAETDWKVNHSRQMVWAAKSASHVVRVCMCLCVCVHTRWLRPSSVGASHLIGLFFVRRTEQSRFTGKPQVFLSAYPHTHRKRKAQQASGRPTDRTPFNLCSEVVCESRCARWETKQLRRWRETRSTPHHTAASSGSINACRELAKVTS